MPCSQTGWSVIIAQLSIPPVNTVITFQTLTVKLQEKEAGGGQTLLQFKMSDHCYCDWRFCQVYVTLESTVYRYLAGQEMGSFGVSPELVYPVLFPAPPCSPSWNDPALSSSSSSLCHFSQGSYLGVQRGFLQLEALEKRGNSNHLGGVTVR